MTTGRSWRLAVTTVAATALLAACSDSSSNDVSPGPRSGSAVGSAAASPSKSLPFGKVAKPGVGATAVRGPSAVARPVHVRIPAIDVDARIVPLALIEDGSLAAPRRWGDAGWYAAGVTPGQVGPAIIAGHIDSTSGPAVFYRLGRLRSGDKVQVTDAGGRVRTFVVDGAHEYAKSRFPTSTVYAATPDAQLRLITCTGAFDASKRSYVDNLVVSAHLVRG